MIEDDITANNLEMEKADEDPASVSLNDENVLEDRKNDLRRVLGEIRRLQLLLFPKRFQGLMRPKIPNCCLSATALSTIT